VTITVAADPQALQYVWNVAKFREALARDGAYLLLSNQPGWSAQEFWETYIQLTVVERAFRVLKSELLLRPIWHHYSGRTEAHVFVCVLAYAELQVPLPCFSPRLRIAPFPTLDASHFATDCSALSALRPALTTNRFVLSPSGSAPLANCSASTLGVPRRSRIAPCSAPSAFLPLADCSAPGN
jgi:hypothetical protein